MKEFLRTSANLATDLAGALLRILFRASVLRVKIVGLTALGAIIGFDVWKLTYSETVTDAETTRVIEISGGNASSDVIVTLITIGTVLVVLVVIDLLYLYAARVTSYRLLRDPGIPADVKLALLRRLS